MQHFLPSNLVKHISSALKEFPATQDHIIKASGFPEHKEAGGTFTAFINNQCKGLSPGTCVRYSEYNERMKNHFFVWDGKKSCSVDTYIPERLFQPYRPERWGWKPITITSQYLKDQLRKNFQMRVDENGLSISHIIQNGLSWFQHRGKRYGIEVHFRPRKLLSGEQSWVPTRKGFQTLFEQRLKSDLKLDCHSGDWWYTLLIEW